MYSRLSFVVFVFAFLFFAFGLAFFSDSYGLVSYKFFGTRSEEIRRDIFNESQSNFNSVVHDMREYKREFDKADTTGKIGIKAIAIQRLDSYPNIQNLPPDVRAFYFQLTH